jgi:hypothetical protein
MMYHRDDKGRAADFIQNRMQKAQEPKPVPPWLVKSQLMNTKALPELVAVCQEALSKLGPDGYFPDFGYPLTERLKRAVAAAVNSQRGAVMGNYLLKTEVVAELTPEILAAAFCSMNDEEQADFFIHADRIARETWTDGLPDSQWHYVGGHLKNCECSTEGARQMVESIHYAMTR